MLNQVVTVRFSDETAAEMDRLIDNGDFATRGEFVKYCVRQVLKTYKGRGPPPQHSLKEDP